MSDVFTTIAAALVDLLTAKLDKINETNKINSDYIEYDIPHDIHDVKYDLTGITITNSDKTTISHGSSFTAILTGDVKAIVITMGGIDNTKTWYDEDKKEIGISYVSGNINIYATNVREEEMHSINRTIVGSAYLKEKTTKVVHGTQYTTEVIVNEGYTLDSIKVEMNDVDITGTTWDSSENTITIPSVIADVNITINAKLNEYTITYGLENALCSQSITVINYGSGFYCTLLPQTGFELDKETYYYTMENALGLKVRYNISDDAVISIESVTGNIYIYAVGKIKTYNISYDYDRTKVFITEKPVSIQSGELKTIVYTLYEGCDPNKPGITVSHADHGLVKSSDGGSITISNAYGNVVISIDPQDLVHSISYYVSNCSVEDPSDKTRKHNEAFSTVITPISGYSIDTIDITMGDTPFDSSWINRRSDKTIVVNIANVTGNVEINASATPNTVSVTTMLNNTTINGSQYTLDSLSYLVSTAPIQIDKNSDLFIRFKCDTAYYKGINVQVSIGGINYVPTLGNTVISDTYALRIPNVTGNVIITASAIEYTTYSFTYNLNGAFLDYTPFQVREDRNYTSFYSSYIENPYIVVAVMMGDEDITNDCVNLTTRKIEIEEITGNVSISIQARPTRQPLTLAAIENMAIGDSKNILIGHPAISSDGYFIGYSGTNFIKYGEGFESIQHTNAIANTISNDLDYKFILTKCQNMSGDPTVTRTYEFYVSGAFSSQTVNPYTEYVSENIDENYKIYYTTLERFGTAVFNSTQPTRNSTIEINYGGALYEGGLPQYIYVYMYKLVAENTVTATVNGGSGTITCKIGKPTDLSNLDNYDQIEVRSGAMTINSITLASNLQNATTNGAHGIYIVVPKGVTLTIPNPNIEYVGDPYYTLQTDSAEDKYISVGAGARVSGENSERPQVSFTDRLVRVSDVKAELKIHDPSKTINNEELLVLGINSENELLILSEAYTLQTNSVDIVHFNSVHLAAITTMLTIYSEEDIWHLYEV